MLQEGPGAEGKRKHRSVACTSTPIAENLDVVNAPQPSTSASPDLPAVLNLVPKHLATIPPPDVPAVRSVAPSPRRSTAPHDGPTRIHNYMVEEYQQLYHQAVDDMLRTKTGRLRQYSLALGLRIKQKLWERLDRPTFTESVYEDGLVQVGVSYKVGVHPPLHELDVSGEPES